jgi:hypothetical protein
VEFQPLVVLAAREEAAEQRAAAEAEARRAEYESCIQRLNQTRSAPVFRTIGLPPHDGDSLPK